MSYQPLCTLTFQHLYFNDGLLQQARLVPTAASSRQMHNAGLLLKATRQGAVLLLDTQQRDIAAACCDPVLTLHFMLYVSDPLFSSYSQPAAAVPQIFYCNNRSPQQTGNSLRLHLQPQLTEADLHDRTDPALAAFAEIQRQPLPALVLELDIEHRDIAALTDIQARNYLLQFGCRRSVWRYYLSSNAFSGTLHIQDVARKIRFQQQENTLLPNGRTAVVFDSAEPLALQQYSSYRFQLVSKINDTERILIKRLPVAFAGQSQTAVINGTASHISEIYLNY